MGNFRNYFFVNYGCDGAGSGYGLRVTGCCFFSAGEQAERVIYALGRLSLYPRVRTLCLFGPRGSVTLTYNSPCCVTPTDTQQVTTRLSILPT